MSAGSRNYGLPEPTAPGGWANQCR
jgi:hypothetical protein